jgi:hypothetical protein
MHSFLHEWSVWINPLWIVLGSALGLHGLRKTMSVRTLIVYVFLTIVLVVGSVRSSFDQDHQQARIELERQQVDQQQRAQVKEFITQQERFQSEQERLDRQQAAIASDIDQLVTLAKEATTPAEVKARIVDITTPSIQIADPSSVTARNISWEAVLWNLEQDGLNPYPIPTQSIDFIKAKTMPLPSDLFNSYGIHPKTGDRIFGYLAVDCGNCGPWRYYLVYFRFGESGWTYAMPVGAVISLKALTAKLPEFKQEKDDKWLDSLAPTAARESIETYNP